MNNFNLTDFYKIFNEDNKYIVKDYINSDGSINTNDDLNLLNLNNNLATLMKTLIFNNKYLTTSAGQNTKIILNENKKYNYGDFSLNSSNNMFVISNINFDCNYYTSQTILKYSFLLDLLIQIFKSTSLNEIEISLNYYKNSTTNDYYTKNIYYNFTLSIDNKLNIIINNLKTSEITYDDLKKLFVIFEIDIIKHLYFFTNNKIYADYFPSIAIYYNTIKLMLNNIILAQINFILFNNTTLENTNNFIFDLNVDYLQPLLPSDTNFSKLLKFKKKEANANANPKFKYYFNGNGNANVIDCTEGQSINFNINSENTIYSAMYKENEYVSEQLLKNVKYYSADYSQNNVVFILNEKNALLSIKNLEPLTTYYFKLHNFSTIFNITNMNQNINTPSDNLYWDNTNKILKIYNTSSSIYNFSSDIKIYMINLNSLSLISPLITELNKSITIINLNQTYISNLTNKINSYKLLSTSDLTLLSKISINSSTITIFDITTNFTNLLLDVNYLPDNFSYTSPGSKLAYLSYSDSLNNTALTNKINSNFFNDYFTLANGIIKPTSFELNKKNKYYNLNNNLLVQSLNNINFDIDNYKNLQVKNNNIIHNINNLHKNNEYIIRDDIVIKNKDLEYNLGNFLSISYFEIYFIFLFVIILCISVFLLIFNNNVLTSIISILMFYILFIFYKILNNNIPYIILPLFFTFFIILSIIFTLFFGINKYTKLFIVIELFMLIIVFIGTTFNFESFTVDSSSLLSSNINNDVVNNINFNDNFNKIFKNITTNMILNNAQITSNIITPIIKKKEIKYKIIHSNSHNLAIEKSNYINKYNKGSYNLLSNRINYLIIFSLIFTFSLFIYGVFQNFYLFIIIFILAIIISLIHSHNIFF